MKKVFLLVTLIGMSFGIKAQNTFPKNDKVGIGTTNPASLLSVGGVGNSRAAIMGTANGASSIFDIGVRGEGTNYGVIGSSSANAIGVYGESNTGVGGYFKSNSGYGLIVAKGKVGIGTTNPNAKLEIGVSHAINQDEEMRIGSYYKSNFYGLGLNYRLSSTGGPSNHLVTYHGNIRKTAMSFVGGKIGIGTVTPDSELTVKGLIHSREVKVTATAGGADFVFENEYDLPNLEKVETYIKKNKHLPEIASAKEMEKNGIHLAKMNIKLLQKIEELTLYTIQQEKRLNSIDLKNEKLEKENESLATNFLELRKRLEKLEKK
jgi:hypothetical protein